MKTISILGEGYVGSAVFSSIANKEEVIIYDKYKRDFNSDSIFESVKKTDFIFACLPTVQHEDGVQDFSAFEETFEKLKGYKGIIVIKSTVLYSNIEPYLKNFNIVLNPEFLNERNAFNDFENEKVIILGGEIHNVYKVKELYQHQFIGKSDVAFEMVTHKQAVNVKYIHNIANFYKVLFWNFVFEITKDHRKMFDLYSKITGITKDFSQVAADGYLGGGGNCYGKDLAAFNHEHKHMLTQFMKDYNYKLRGDQP